MALLITQITRGDSKMKKLAICIGLATLAAGFSGYTSAEDEYGNLYGFVQAVDDQAHTATIDGKTYGFTMHFAGEKASEIICNKCRVLYRLDRNAISYVNNSPIVDDSGDSNDFDEETPED